jgi:hypothetical protein
VTPVCDPLGEDLQEVSIKLDTAGIQGLIAEHYGVEPSAVALAFTAGGNHPGERDEFRATITKKLPADLVKGAS